MWGKPASAECGGEVLRVRRRAVLAAEDQVVVLVRFSPRQALLDLADTMRLQLLERRRVESNRPAALARLRLAELDAVRSHDERLDDVETGAFEVDCRPGQTENLTPPQARRARQQPRRVEAIVTDMIEKRAELLWGPDLHLGLRDLRDPRRERNVGRNELPPDRVVERSPKARVDVTDRLWWEPATPPPSTGLRQLRVTTLEIVGRELLQQDVTEVRHQVRGDLEAVIVVRARPHGALDGRQPTLEQELAERHLRWFDVDTGAARGRLALVRLDRFLLRPEAGDPALAVPVRDRVARAIRDVGPLAARTLHKRRHDPPSCAESISRFSAGAAMEGVNRTAPP